MASRDLRRVIDCIRAHLSIPVRLADIVEVSGGCRTNIDGLYVKLVANISSGHGTIEWVFGDTEIGVLKTGKQFAVCGVSVIDVANGHISRNLEYHDTATITKQVGALPEQKQ